MELQSLKQRFGIIGNSPALNYALSIAQRVAPTNLTVLITGESGVGKEVFSKVIHNLSSRKHNPFIAVNCGAIPEGTIDSGLFGHEKGAFTGASDSRKGYFEYVSNGTIFLDEIGEMPVGTQARLLRVLESGEYIRVGSSKVQKTDVRVVAATNVELMEAVKKGKFREDLYYRLSTVPIIVPPLRERKEDIYLLFRKFVADFSDRHNTTPIHLDEEARSLLENYKWPGNIRELKNIAEQLSVLARDKMVGPEELKKYIPEIDKTNLPALANMSRSDFESGFRAGSGNASGAGEEGFGGGKFSERDLLYKLFFDIKKDINDMKKFLYDGHGHSVRNQEAAYSPSTHEPEYSQGEEHHTPITTGKDGTIIINSSKYEDDEVEESLNIAEKERELIGLALKKHKGKRKDAALDLGVSERTLYRKIKEYNIQE